MTLEAPRRTRNQQIDDVIRMLEHAWKMQRDWSFADLVDFVLVDDDYATFLASGDATVERRLRDYLQLLMKRARDET